MQSIEIKTTQNVTIEYELASLRERILASFIDLIIVGGVYMLVFFFIATVFTPLLDTFAGGIIFGLMPILGFVGYQFLSELLSDGQSLGKKALNIKVVRLDGRQPSPTDYLLRAVFHVVDSIFSSGILAALVISTTIKRQRLGDMTAHTTVIRTSNNVDFRLEDILRINSIEDYSPTYPEVKKLNDEDMLVIKNVIKRYMAFENPAHAEAVDILVQKIAPILNIAPPEGNKIEFLRILLKDYIVLTR